MALAFINAVMRVSGLEPGIIKIENQEVFTEEAERGIMDFPVLTISGHYTLFEFHSTPLTEKLLLRNFQYLANFRAKVDYPVELHIISIEKLKKSVRSVLITPDWEFSPKFTFLIDFDGDKILNTIKNKIENEIELTDMDAYLLAVLPFTSHEMETVEFVKQLIYFINEISLSETHKYIIKLSQILWVNALVKDESLKQELLDVVKMKSNFIQEYERNLVETAVNETRAEEKLEFAQWMMSKDYSREEILDVTGVDILEI